MAIQFRTLGGIDLRGDDGLPLPALLAQPKRVALLAYLALEAVNGYARRDTLTALFWPERDSAHARGSLRQAIHFIRQCLGEDAVRSAGDEGLAIAAGKVVCDATAFRADCEARRYEAALARYGGEFLPGLYVPEGDEGFDAWLARQRATLSGEAVAAAKALALARRTEGRLDEAIVWIRRAVELAPDDEILRRTLIESQAQSGDRAGALHSYDHFVDHLQRQLGVAPSAATRALAQDVRAGALDVLPDVVHTESGVGIGLFTFVNDSGDSAHDFVCHALTDELRSLLAQEPALRPMLIPTEFGLGNRRPDLQRLRQRLNVRYIVDGGVGRAGPNLRIDAYLVDVIDSRRVWADSRQHDARAFDSLLGIVARAFAGGVQLAITGHRSAFGERPTQSVEAYSLYLKARYCWNQRPRMFADTITLFNRAIEIDPGFALAHAALADAYNTLGAWEGSVMPPLEAFPAAQSAVARALALDPHLAEAHSAQGYTSMHYFWQWGAGEAQLRHAIALKPGYAHAHHWLSHLLMARGRVEESYQASRLALACDPLDFVINIHLAWHHWQSREYRQGLEQCERSAEIDANNHLVPLFQGLQYIELGEAIHAIDAHRAAVERSGSSTMAVAFLGYSYAVGGERRLARGVLKQLRERGAHRGMFGYEMSLIHSALGEIDAAFVELERGWRERSTWLAYIDVDPRLDALRSDPRFLDLRARVNLPPSPIVASPA